MFGRRIGPYRKGIQREHARPAAAYSKFRAVPVYADDGTRFDSRLEAERYVELLGLLRAGAIDNLKVHPWWTIHDAYVDERTGAKVREIRYEADFSYEDPEGEVIVEDVKSPFTAKDPVFRLKLKMFRKRYPDYVFRIVNPRERRK